MWWIHFATRWKINCPLTVGFDGTPKLDPCWKSQTITYKVNAEWKSELNLWTMTILNKLVTNLIDKKYDDNEQETSTTETEVFALKTETYFCLLIYNNFSYWERTWTDVEPETNSPIAYPVSNQLSTLLRHGHLLREEDGSIEFWRLKRWSSEQIWALSLLVWWCGRARLQETEVTREDFTVLTSQEEKFVPFELLKGIQDAIPLILHCKTVY